MKTAVIYRTTSGFTKRYAEWISHDLNADLFDCRDIDRRKMLEYDAVIFGGSLHAIGISGIKLIKNNLSKLSGRKVIVFAVGASPVKEGLAQEIRDKNFTAEQQKQVRFYYLRGGFDFSKLDVPNKIIMTLLKWVLLRKKARTPDEEGMLAGYATPLDATDRSSISGLVAYAKGN